jgi:hypothetical protein
MSAPYLVARRKCPREFVVVCTIPCVIRGLVRGPTAHNHARQARDDPDAHYTMTSPKHLTVQRISYPGFTVSSGFAEAHSL